MTNTVPTGQPIPCFTVAGPVQIWGNTGSAGAVEFLGWTRGGLEIQEQPFIAELKSDLSGGEQGPPGDFQWLGGLDMIIAELAQYNPAILGKYERRFNAGITTITKGALMKCSGAGFKVLFISLNFARFYTNVFITEPIGYAPIGTPASFPRLTFTGLEDSGNTDGRPWISTGFSVSGSTVTFT